MTVLLEALYESMSAERPDWEFDDEFDGGEETCGRFPDRSVLMTDTGGTQSMEFDGNPVASDIILMVAIWNLLPT
jgi:hypothetical protein